MERFAKVRKRSECEESDKQYYGGNACRRISVVSLLVIAYPHLLESIAIKLSPPMTRIPLSRTHAAVRQSL